ncbi:Hsp20/alpha crystallin family protein [Pseudonocardia endophytica]|uniref:HSP20 family protein n=1 Tax=Pseudonocardia endophytica TaxID=401976 RepID=A0A4R1HN49_PSEEN|nr:Hsp20/alpha crystallin family protein [Pseudonocardia endophytica]TCK21099.1 HSP20 family protein [Pseudonocardia endophytica]
MLMRTDPLREFDRLAQQAFSSAGTWSRPAAMPMDAWRHGDEFVVEFDLPGVDPSAVELSVERNTLTVRAERRPTHHEDGTETIASERPLGVYSRQLFLGDSLDTDNIGASYDAGVLTVRIPVAEKAKPRTISIQSSPAADHKAINV